jgi:hypothetical protein
MDVRVIFREISEQLLSEFRKTAQVKHTGGQGTLREDAFAKFLSDYLPTRYAVGRGEIISSMNHISGQLDVVIYDPSHCPTLLKSSAHAVFPIESVYGVVSIKSTLSSSELKDAYQNVANAKRLVDPRGFMSSSTPGLSMGMAAPRIVGVVLAYQADRSLDAIAEQARKLDAELADQLILRPDFIAVLGDGMVGPSHQLRSEGNAFSLPAKLDELSRIRRTKRHTLLRVYLQLLAEMNALVLRNLDLRPYLDMPARIGGHLVGRSRFVRTPIGMNLTDGRVIRLTAKGVEKIVKHAKAGGAVTMQQHCMNTLGLLPQGVTPQFLAGLVFEYNPRNLPPLDISKITRDAQGQVEMPKDCYQPVPIRIDGEPYFVDMFALDADDMEEDPDIDADELLSE